MRSKFLQLFSCVAVMAILLSGCASEQRKSSSETPAPSIIETTQAANDSSVSDTSSNTEKESPTANNESASNSETNTVASDNHSNSPDSSNSQQSKLPVESTSPETQKNDNSNTEKESPMADNESAPNSGTNTVTSDNRPNSSDSSNTQQTKPTEEPNPPVLQPSDNSNTEENIVKKMTLQIGDSTFTATLENNDAVDALVDMMREATIVIQMSDYSGFEKVGSLGTSLPTSNKQTTTQSGDIVLYNGNQIVIFYGSNSWSYTRLGKIDDLSGWTDALGSGDVTVTFSIK